MTRQTLRDEYVMCDMTATPKKRQSGFSLIEMMVAMVIGLILVLAAGSVLIANLQTFRQVEWLRDKQAAVTVAVDVLARDIRRARSVEIEEGGTGLELSVSNRGDSAVCGIGEVLDKTYRVEESGSNAGEFVLRVDVRPNPDSECDAAPYDEPIVGGFSGAGIAGIEFEDVQGDGAIWEITLRLRESPAGLAGETPQNLTFNVVNRNSALGKATN